MSGMATPRCPKVAPRCLKVAPKSAQIAKGAILKILKSHIFRQNQLSHQRKFDFLFETLLSSREN